MKLAIGIPWSSPFMYSATAESLMNLRPPDGYEVKYFRGLGWCQAKMHNDFCERSLKWGADRLCILGPDQVYDEFLLEKLTKHMDSGCEVISAMIPARNMVPGQDMKPFQPLAWRIHESPDNPYRNPVDNADMIDVIKKNTGLNRIDVIGSGVLMFDTDILNQMKKPWFAETLVGDDFSRTPGMDSIFVWRLKKELGIQVWCDTNIEVKHLDVFEIDDTFQDRFSDKGKAE